jgi:site-specific DNA-methyltransferase (adenine-specific)
MAGPMDRVSYDSSKGRWPANLILDEDAAAILDEQSGVTSTTGKRRQHSQGRDVPGTAWGNTNHKSTEYPGDTGGASRFFYVAKASRSERNAGLDGMEERKVHPDEPNGRVWDIPGSHSTARANHHPTVKPIALMRWLVRLVTPPDGTVLDPFMGSGTTGIAAGMEGFEFIGIEREEEYIEIARRRIEHWEHPLMPTRKSKVSTGPQQLPLTGDD